MRKPKTCDACQYYRAPMLTFTEGEWCSNSESPHTNQYVLPIDSCKEFIKRGKKAPWWMRLYNWALRIGKVK